MSVLCYYVKWRSFLLITIRSGKYLGESTLLIMRLSSRI